jgi:hypothetical protein
MLLHAAGSVTRACIVLAVDYYQYGCRMERLEPIGEPGGPRSSTRAARPPHVLDPTIGALDRRLARGA